MKNAFTSCLVLLTLCGFAPTDQNSSAKSSEDKNFSGGDNLKSIITSPAIPRGRGNVISDDDILYSSIIRNARGILTIDYIIGVNGRVESCDILKSSGFPAQDKHMCDTIIRRWRFTPSTINGEPARQKRTLSFKYNVNSISIILEPIFSEVPQPNSLYKPSAKNKKRNRFYRSDFSKLFTRKNDQEPANNNFTISDVWAIVGESGGVDDCYVMNVTNEKIENELCKILKSRFKYTPAFIDGVAVKESVNVGLFWRFIDKYPFVEIVSQP